MSAETGVDGGAGEAPAPPEADVEPLADRERRALTERMTVLDDLAPAPADAPGLYHVTTESGSSYVVEPDREACTCPDFRFRGSRGVACKHIARVRLETGRTSIPAWVDREAIDDLFREFVTPTEGERGP